MRLLHALVGGRERLATYRIVLIFIRESFSLNGLDIAVPVADKMLGYAMVAKG